jgi:hypothetical protein
MIGKKTKTQKCNCKLTVLYMPMPMSSVHLEDTRMRNLPVSVREAVWAVKWPGICSQVARMTAKFWYKCLVASFCSSPVNFITCAGVGLHLCKLPHGKHTAQMIVRSGLVFYTKTGNKLTWACRQRSYCKKCKYYSNIYSNIVIYIVHSQPMKNCY